MEYMGCVFVLEEMRRDGGERMYEDRGVEGMKDGEKGIEMEGYNGDRWWWGGMVFLEGGKYKDGERELREGIGV